MVVCVTLGKRGAVALVNGTPVISEGRAVTAVDTTGAGDCFVGAVASQLAAGKSIGDALGYANIAASICVQRMGAAPSMPSAAEVEAASQIDLSQRALQIETGIHRLLRRDRTVRNQHAASEHMIAGAIDQLDADQMP